MKRVKSSKPIDELITELWEVTEEELIERVRWLDGNQWSAAVAADLALGQRYRDAKEAFSRRKGIELGLAEQPVLDDLRRVGIDFGSVYSLGANATNFEAGVPALLTHATRDYPDVIREGIYRSLAARKARPLAWDAVLSAYIAEPNKSHTAGPGVIGAPSGPKEGMVNALSAMATPADLPTLIKLIADTKNGPSRIFFVANLARSRSPLALETLASLSNDPELKTEIAIRLKAKMRRQAKKEGKRSARN